MEVSELDKILEIQGSTTMKEFVGDNMQLIKETSKHSAIVIDKINGLIHSFKPDNRPNQIVDGVEIRSMSIGELQYVYAYMDQEQLKATLDRLVASASITAQRKLEILNVFKAE